MKYKLLSRFGAEGGFFCYNGSTQNGQIMAADGPTAANRPPIPVERKDSIE